MKKRNSTQANVTEIHTAIYARYSSHNQDDGTSIDVQLEVCRRAAGEPTTTYIDRAVTGTTMQRDAFCRLLDDCEAGRINKVYVYKWDRFGRSARAHAVIADLEDWGVKVISATEGAEPLSRGIQLVVAEDFSRKLGERVKAAKQLRFQQGAFYGGFVPFGYRVIQQGTIKRLEPDWGGQAEVVQWMFQTYSRDCIGTKQMARLMNEKGVKARRSKYWGASTVRMILANTLYVGRPVRLGHISSRLRHQGLIHHDNPSRKERVDPLLQIVDEGIFKKVQQKQRTRKILRPLGQNRTRLFSKLLYCGCCGGVFVRTGHNSTKIPSHYWTCGIRQRQDTGKCPNDVYMNEQTLVKTIQRGFDAVFEDAESIITEATSRTLVLMRESKTQVSKLDARIGTIDKELERLASMLIDSDLSNSAVKRLLSSQVAEKTKERDGLVTTRSQATASDSDPQKNAQATVRRAFDEAKKGLTRVASPSEYNQFVRDFVGIMMVYPDGSIRPPNAGSPSASAQSDWAHYYRNQRILASLHIDSASNIEILQEAAPSSFSWIRQKSRHLLAMGFASEDSLDHALLRALVLGDNDPELRDIQEQFRRTGTSHHLAISGLHVAVLGAFVFGICRLLRLRPRASIIITTCFVALYGAAALPSPPVVRSVLLGLFVGVGLSSGRQRDPLQLLCISILAMLIYKPMDLFGAGFQLSFGVVLGLIIFTPPLDKWLRNLNADDWPLARQKTRPTISMFLDYFSRVFAAGFVAWFISMPLVAYHFGQINPWAIVASIVLAPVVFVALVGGFLKIILTMLFPGASTGWAYLATQPMRLMRATLGWLDGVPGNDFPFPAPPLWVIVIFYAFCLLMLLPYRRPKWHLLIRFGPVTLCTLVMLLPVFRVKTSILEDEKLKITLLSVGAGQCAVIEAPGGKTVLIDAGSNSLTDALRKCIAPFLRTEGVTEIDQMILTHSDYDHISAAGDIAGVYDVREVLCGPRFRPIASENAAADFLLRKLDLMNLPPRVLSAGERIPLSRDAEIEVLSSPKDPTLSSNDSAVVCQIHYAGRSILFTGDIQEDAEESLLKSPEKLRADVLIAPHHGSIEDSTKAFVDAVNPTYVLSSNDRSLTGKQKRFDALMKDRQLYRTNECGALTVIVHHDGRLEVERFLKK